MKQTNIYDFLNEVLEAEVQRQYHEASTDVEEQDIDVIPPVPVIEQVITNYFAALEVGTLPTLQEAQTITLLDNLSSKYND